MKRVALGLLYCCCICFNGYSQEKISTAEKRWAGSFSTGFAPMPHAPIMLLPGMEFYITPKFSILFEYAFQTGKNNDYDSIALNKKFTKYKTELRFYPSSNKRRLRSFLGLQVSLADRSFNIGKSGSYFKPNPNDSVFTFNKASVKSPFRIIAFQFGISRRIVNDFYFESSIGLGIKHISTAYSSVENLQGDVFRGLFRIKPVSTYRYLGNFTRPYLGISYRFIYQF
jgi:hypothetical protein